MRRTLSAIFIVLSIVTALAAFGVQLGTSWTYQGQLRRSGAAYTGTCNFQFSLWDAASAGLQVGNTQSINSVNVVNGLFTVELGSGDLFRGSALWLRTAVQCSGDGGFTSLDPRQPITAAPYAMSLLPGATISSSTGTTALAVENTVAEGVGVVGQAKGVGVYGNTQDPAGLGVYGTANGANGAGVFGLNSSGAGVWGKSTGTGSAIYGENTGTGLAGRFAGPVDVAGRLTATNSSSSGIGIDSIAFVGVQGKTTSPGGSGVYGEALLANSAGVYGTNRDSAAIWGRSTGAGSAVYGENTSTGYAGRFVGPVSIQGTLTKSAGTFQIDHPLDPANKFLSHSFVESPDMKNIYDGNVTTDATGSAIVTLPPYFAALNRDYRYQLTVLGQFAQAIVSREIAGNSFEIHTDKPAVKVSWQVTGIRQDAYAQANPIVVEKFKPAEEKGLYLYPAGFGAGEEKRIGHLKGPALAPGAQNPAGAGQSDLENK